MEAHGLFTTNLSNMKLQRYLICEGMSKDELVSAMEAFGLFQIHHKYLK
jgi:hypothetical protein